MLKHKASNLPYVLWTWLQIIRTLSRQHDVEIDDKVTLSLKKDM